MDDLIAFVRARLDEDEAAARAAVQSGNQFAEPGDHDPRWQRMEGHGGGEIRDMCSHHRGCIVVFDEGAPGPEEAAHIARHDPARALREVTAKRAIVQRYEHESGSGLPGRRAALDVLIGPLRDLAAIWSDHQEYRQEWKP